MIVVLAIFGVAACVWGAAFAQRGSLWVGCAAFVAGAYVLGPPLWSPRVGPVTLTADRVLFAALVAAMAWQWLTGRISLGAITEFDWLLLAAVAYFTLRCAVTPAPPVNGAAAGPWWRLVSAFWIPAGLYLAARTTPLDERSWGRFALGLAALGVFLACIAFAEIGRQWWAVFPRYIANPELGTHFGRARGPALNSASLGVELAYCFWAAWLLVPQVRRPAQLTLAAILTAIAGAVYFTYTRSTWIGLAACLGLIPLLQMPRQRRFAAALAVMFAGAVGVVACGEKITNLVRQDSDSSAEHSVYQRASFAIVSARMFADYPVFGCGFGRFYDLKLPYLSNRSQQVELESLRKLDHHNTLLSILVETGLVGLALFVGLLAGWAKTAWTLLRGEAAGSWQRRLGLFAVATLVTYLASALFHDLTLSPSEHWVLFLAAGAAVNLVAQRRQALVSAAVFPVQSAGGRTSATRPGSFAT